MSDIDEVIRRSREPGQFSERKEFTIAKERGIQKMRKFALKTPSHYILEFIQGAVANGATYIDILVNSQTTRVAWTGGVFALEHLQQIFDFLFSDKSEKEFTAIRQLAIGVNAMLHFKPRQIVIESGDGTMANSTRIEIDPKSMNIVAGRPEQPIKGTFILADKKRKSGDEERLIEERCLSLTIPILVNDRVLFGYSSVRSFNLLGVKKSIKFDEGDFYGTIGLSKSSNTDRFKILTHGVWIQTVKRDLGLPYKFGGIIAFDALNKTADHAAIVEDEKWQEMWARVSLFARELVSGRDLNTISLKLSDGSVEDLASCRKRALEAGGAILFKEGVAKVKLIPDYEKIYGFPGFLSSEENYKIVSDLLLGNGKLFVAKGSEKELRFLRQPKANPPRGPFFVEPLDVQLTDVNRKSATIYTPRDQDLSFIEFIQRGRIVKGIECPDYPKGFHIRVKVDSDESVQSMTSSRFIKDILQACRAQTIALSTRIANEYTPVIQIDSLGAFHVLHAIAACTIFSIKGDRFSIRRLGVETKEILDVPILRTLDGQPKSILEIVDLMNTQFGLVYGSVEGIHSDTRGLDPSRILALSPLEEKELVAIFGDAAYVRIDCRDILASTRDEKGREFTIRDIAIGLGIYDSRFILCENNENITLEIARKLIVQLKACVVDIKADSELRRQSLRHLIWTLSHPSTPPQLIDMLADFPLFRNQHDKVVPLKNLHNLLEMFDGWPQGPIALPALDEKVGTEKSMFLAFNPFVFHMLSRKFQILSQGLFDGEKTDLRDAVLSTWISENAENASGLVCLMPRSAKNALHILDIEERSVKAYGYLPERLMCSGELFGSQDEFLRDIFLDQSIKLYGKVADLLWESQDLEQISALAEPALFGALHLIVVRRAGAFLNLSSRFSEIEMLLSRKIFQSRQGLPLSAHALTQHYEFPLDELAENAPAYQKEWLQILLNAETIGNAFPDAGNSRDDLWTETIFSSPIEGWAASFVNQVTNIRGACFEDIDSPSPFRIRGPQHIIVSRDNPNRSFLLNMRVIQEFDDSRIWLALRIILELRGAEIISAEKQLEIHEKLIDLKLV